MIQRGRTDLGQMIQQSSGTGQSLAQENQNLKVIIQTMKNEMDTIVERIKSEYVIHSPKSEDQQYVRLQQVVISKNQKIDDLKQENESLKDQLTKLKAERERLIEISNDLRADLNRSQRLVNDLMTKITVSPKMPPNGMISPQTQDQPV